MVVSTASPFKFCGAVLEGLGHPGTGDGLSEIAELEALTGVSAPAPLAALRNAKVRFSESVEKEQMETVVSDFLR